MGYISKKNIIVFLTSWVVLLFLVFDVYLVTVQPKRFPQTAMKCILQDMEPWSEKFAPAFAPMKAIDCGPKSPFFFVNESGFILYNKPALGPLKTEHLNCSYQAVNRISEQKIALGKRTSFKAPSFINSRAFLVTCMGKDDTLVYRYVHYNVAFNESIEREKQIQFESDQRPSIIIIGIDSTSRSHAIRSLQHSYTYMTGVLHAYDFNGYNVVGENTFPNLLALVAGTDWRNMTGSPAMKGYLDFLPLLWQDKQQYATYMCEDSPVIETFNHERKGFKVPPADHYCRPLMQAMAKYPPVINKSYRYSSKCYGNKKYIEIQLDQVKQFLSKYTGKLKTVFMWNNMAHDNFFLVRNADKSLHTFLRWLKSNRHLNNTILLLVSDHGFRIGGPSTLPVGKIEKVNPMCLMYVPKSLKQKHRWMENNLNFNKDKLTTPHDIYWTLQDFMSGNVHDADMRVVPTTSLQPRRLFQKIHNDRTCEDAGIPIKYCIRCYEFALLKPETQQANKLANFSVMTLNKHLQNFSQCQRFTLAKVVRYNKIVDPSNHTVSRGSLFLISFKTKPGLGFFDALLRYNPDFPLNSSNIEPVGLPLRMSFYGNQSHCVHDSLLKTICYCK